MLTQLRQFAQGFWARVLIGVLILSFAIWGVSGVILGYRSSSNIANVGGQGISQGKLVSSLDRIAQNISKQQKIPRATVVNNLLSSGIWQIFLKNLIDEAAFEEFTARFRLFPSDDQVAKYVASTPAFKKADGSFNRPLFDKVLARNNLTERQYMNDVKTALGRQRVAQGILDTMRLPPMMMKVAQLVVSQERKATYAVLLPVLLNYQTPTFQQLQAFYTQHKDVQAIFQIPEARDADVLALAPQNFLPQFLAEVTNAEVKKSYEDGLRHGKYQTPEKRRVEVLGFKNPQEAEKVSSALQSGMSFQTLLKRLKLKESDVSLGLVEQSSILDSIVATSAFSLSLDGSSEPLADGTRTVIVHVNEIQPAKKESFADISDKIKHDIAFSRAKEKVLDLRDVVDDALANPGATLASVAKDNHIKLLKLKNITASGETLDNKEPLSALHLKKEISQRLLAVIFSQSAHQEPISQELEDGVYWIAVSQITPASQPPLVNSLDSARKGVVTVADLTPVYIDSLRYQTLLGKAKGILQGLKDGDSLDDLKAKFGFNIFHTSFLNVKSDKLPADVMAALFKINKVGDASAIITKQDNVIAKNYKRTGPLYIVRLDSVRVVKDSPLWEKVQSDIQGNLNKQLQESTVASFLRDIELAYGVRINKSVIESMKKDASPAADE